MLNSDNKNKYILELRVSLFLDFMLQDFHVLSLEYSKYKSEFTPHLIQLFLNNKYFGLIT